MSYNKSTGVISPTDPITMTDVMRAVGISNYADIGSLVKKGAELGRINMMSMYKPVVKQGKLNELTISDFIDVNYGLSIPVFSTPQALWNGVPQNGKWTYVSPSGGTDSPYRMGDFRGYYAKAPKEISVQTGGDTYAIDYLGDGGTSVKVYTLLKSGLYAFRPLEGKDYSNQSDEVLRRSASRYISLENVAVGQNTKVLDSADKGFIAVCLYDSNGTYLETRRASRSMYYLLATSVEDQDLYTILLEGGRTSWAYSSGTYYGIACIVTEEGYVPVQNTDNHPCKFQINASGIGVYSFDAAGVSGSVNGTYSGSMRTTQSTVYTRIRLYNDGDNNVIIPASGNGYHKLCLTSHLAGSVSDGTSTYSINRDDVVIDVANTEPITIAPGASAYIPFKLSGIWDVESSSSSVVIESGSIAVSLSLNYMNTGGTAFEHHSPRQQVILIVYGNNT